MKPPFRTFITRTQYASIDEIPRELRDTVALLARGGLELTAIAAFTSLPEDWVRQLTEEPTKKYTLGFKTKVT